MDREQLVTGLNRALHLMQQIVGLQSQKGSLITQYKPFEKKKNLWLGAKGFFIAFGISILFTAIFQYVNVFYFALRFLGSLAVFAIYGNSSLAPMWLPWIEMLLGAIPLAFILKAVVNMILKKQNVAIDTRNTQKETHNQAISAQIAGVDQQVANVQQQYANEVAAWYPPDYCTIAAAAFFINVVQNHKANSVGEAAVLYDTHLHQQRVEQNQQEMIAQQKLTHMLQVGTIIMQGATAAAINQNTAATTQAAVANQASRNRNTDALNGATDALNNFNKKIRR